MTFVAPRDTDRQTEAPRDPMAKPRHSGIFFELGAFELQRLKFAGYRRVGVGLVLLNSDCHVLVIEHKGNHKVDDRMISLTTETTGGHRINGQVVSEPTMQTIGRCISEELGLDLSKVGATTRFDQHFTFTDWPIGVDASLGRLLGINVALLLDDATASRASEISETDEAYCAYFVDPTALIGDSYNGHAVRPGTADCLRSLGESGLLDVTQVQDAAIHFPELIVPEFDIDLTRL